MDHSFNQASLLVSWLNFYVSVCFVLCVYNLVIEFCCQYHCSYFLERLFAKVINYVWWGR